MAVAGLGQSSRGLLERRPAHRRISRHQGGRPVGYANFQRLRAALSLPDIARVGADRQLRSWKPTGEGKQVKNAGGHNEDIFKLTGNGTLLATGSGDKTVRLWDATTLASTKTLNGLTDHVFAVAISPDSTFVAGGSYDGEVRVWKVADGTPVAGFNASPGQSTKFVLPPPPKKK